MKTIRLIFGLCLLLPFVASGQKKGDAPEPLRVRFLFLDESAGAYSVKRGEQFVDLGIQPYAISAPVDFPPGSRLDIHKFLPDPVAAKPVRTRVLAQETPAGMVHVLAVVAPASGANGYRVRFYDVDPKKAPPRSIRLLNLSPAPMAGRFGKTEVEVAPGALQLVSPGVDRRNRVRSFVAWRAGESWRMVFNSFLSMQENERMTGVMIYSASGMIHTYTEAELAINGRPRPGCFWLTFSDTL